MIKSMTGYGKASASHASKTITAEIKSLNSKGFDASLKTSSLYREKELEIRSTASAGLQRGKVEVALYTESASEDKRTEVNHALAKQYYEQLKALGETIGSEPDNYLSLVMRMPDVLTSERPELTDEEWKVASGLIDEAIAALNDFRAQEGAHLEKDLRQRIDNIGSLREQVKGYAAERTNEVRNRLNEAMSQLQEREQIDENRFEQELIYYLEKLDITEELVRLEGHCKYFLETLDDEAGQGKKLGFIGQEIGREINTIGSKANHTEIQRLVVQMKDELEKIKEQVLNIL